MNDEFMTWVREFDGVLSHKIVGMMFGVGDRFSCTPMLMNIITEALPFPLFRLYILVKSLMKSSIYTLRRMAGYHCSTNPTPRSPPS